MGSAVSSKKKTFKLDGSDTKTRKNKKQKITPNCFTSTGAEEGNYIFKSSESRNQLRSDMDRTGNINDKSVLTLTTKDEERQDCTSSSDLSIAAATQGKMETVNSFTNNSDKSELTESACDNLDTKDYTEPRSNISENESETKTFEEMNNLDSNNGHTEFESSNGTGHFSDQVDGASSQRHEEVASGTKNKNESTDGSDVPTDDGQKENIEKVENDGCNDSANGTDKVPVKLDAEGRNTEEEKQPPAAENGNPANPLDVESGKQTDEKDKEVKGDLKADDNKQTSSEYLLNDNLQFYRNEIHSRPFPGAKIEDMLEWKGDYLKLERTHSYIQWLFPIPESRGMNYSAQPLQEHEAQAISEDKYLQEKVRKAFEMMLHFYGMELGEDRHTVKRGDNWEERYENLNWSIHNHFRITRIIKSLGVLGLKELQVSWLEFIIHEAVYSGKLPKLNDQSTMSHFIDALKEDEDKGKMYHYLADLNDPSRKTAERNKNGFEDDAESNGKADEVREENNSVTCDKGDELIENTKKNSTQYSKEETPDEVNENPNPMSDKGDIESSRENSADIGEEKDVEKSNDDSEGDKEDKSAANFHSQTVGIDENESDDNKGNNTDANQGNSAKEKNKIDEGNKCDQADNLEESSNNKDMLKDEDGGLSNESETNSKDTEANELASTLEKSKNDDDVNKKDTCQGDESNEGLDGFKNNKADSENKAQFRDEDRLNEQVEESGGGGE